MTKPSVAKLNTLGFLLLLKIVIDKLK